MSSGTYDEEVHDDSLGSRTVHGLLDNTNLLQPARPFICARLSTPTQPALVEIWFGGGRPSMEHHHRHRIISYVDVSREAIETEDGRHFSDKFRTFRVFP